MSPNTLIQVASASIALMASGGIATLSLFDVPELQAQPASRSLPAVRWLFSRGSHIFPTAAAASSAGFAYVAFNSIPNNNLQSSNFMDIVRSLVRPSSPAASYMLAAVLCISIAPFTTLVMIPTNFELIKRNEEKGGFRSKSASELNSHKKPGQRSAEDSVNGMDEGSQLQDLSLPQERTRRDTTTKDDEEVRQLLGYFGKLNFVRAILLGAGGILGLYTAVVPQ